jgi:hypothetical protein
MVCIVGSKDRARTLIDMIVQSNDKRIKIFGCLETDKSLVGSTINHGYRVFYTINNIATVLTANVIDEKKAKEMLERLSRYEDFLVKANQPGESLSGKDLAFLEEIRSFRFKDHMGIPRQVITEEEYANLSIPRGTLNPAERTIMENHVLVTEKLLSNMPFIKKYKNVPEIASAHHEKINGSGYPHHLQGEEIPIGGRIMAIADFFDALTASDRPYKKAMSSDEAFTILEKSAEKGELDKDLLQIFRDSKIYATDTQKKGVFET